MENHENCFLNTFTDCPFRITFDAERSEGISEEVGSHTHALWSEYLNAGVYICTNGRCGVYGRDDEAVDALNAYWVEHEGQIAEALQNTDDFEVACTIVIGVISGYIAQTFMRGC